MSTRRKQYNLRSGRTAVQISVQLQFQLEEGNSAEATTSMEAMDRCQVSVYNSDKSSIHLDEFVNTVESDVKSDVSGRMFHKFDNRKVNSTGKVD